jgi:uncharacterized protein (TIGR02246 family)
MSSELTVGRQAQDEGEVRALIDRLDRAWTSNDAGAYAAEFSADAEYVGPDGTHARGRDAIAAAYRKLFEGPLKGTALSGELEEIRFLGPDVILAHGGSALRLPWQTGQPARRPARQTVVLQRHAGRWQVVALHSSRVRHIPTEGPAYTAATLAMELGREVARRAPALSRTRR